MFQNGMPEEVPNYFMQEEVSKHAHEPSGRGPFEVDQGMFRNQRYIDPRTQLLGQQQFQQFAYPGASFVPKVTNGEYVDSRMRYMSQPYLEPVHLQPQANFTQAYEFQRQQQAMQLARQQQEMLMSHAQGLAMPFRPQMVKQMDYGMRAHVPGDSDHRGLMAQQQQQHIEQQQMVKPLELLSDSEAIENLNDLFGGVEKLFADDHSQEAKPAITGLGSLGASLINGCEAELFGDSNSLPADNPLFGRGIQQAFRKPMEHSKVHESLGDHHTYTQKVTPGQAGGGYFGAGYMQQGQGHQPPSVGLFGNDALQHHSQSAPQQQRMDGPSTDNRWQGNSGNTDNFPLSRNLQHGNPMARNTLQLFRDMDENENSGQASYGNKQVQRFDQAQKSSLRENAGDQEATRQVGTGFSLGVQDAKQRITQAHHSEGSPLQFPSQHSLQQSDSGPWSKQPIMKPGISGFQSPPPAEGYRIQPDQLLLDPGKQQHEEVQRLLSIGNSTSSGPFVHGSSLSGQAKEDGRLHQGDLSFKPRPFPEVSDVHKQRLQDSQNASRLHNPNGFPSSALSHSQGVYGDSISHGKATENHVPVQASSAFPWNISARQSTPDAWLRNNSLEAFKSPLKPVGGTSSDTPSTSEVGALKATKDSFSENGPSSSDRDQRFPEKSDYKLSKSPLQMSEKTEAEAEPSPLRGSTVRPQNHLSRFPSSMSPSFQDMSKRHVLSLNGDARSPMPGLSRTEDSMNQVKEQEAMPAFQSSGPTSTSKSAVLSGVLSASPQASAQQERPQQQQVQAAGLTEVQRILRDAPSVSGQNSSLYHSQHRPTESDSINDIVQQQHKVRAVPSAAAPGKIDIAAHFATKQADSPQPLPRTTPDEKCTDSETKLDDAGKDESANLTNKDSSTHLSGGVPQQILGKPTDAVQVSQQQPASLPQSSVPFMPVSPSSSQQIFQQSREQHSADLQRMHQQQVQAALQAYAMSKGGAVTSNMTESGTAVATPPGVQSEATSLQGTMGAMKQQLLLNSTFANSVLPKKRKFEVPPLIPWRTAISQLSGALPTIRPAELQWAVETNRLPERDIDEEYYAQDESLQFVGRARQRLKLTTQLLQHVLPPVPAALMQSNAAGDRESATYVVAQLSVGEACRITANEVPQAKTNTLSATSELIVESFRDRIKYLERALQRLESLPLSLEFVKNMQYLDKVCVTNRLMRCHQELFPVNFSSQRRIQALHRSYPQPYVTPVPMPSSLPEGFQLVSL